jgi:NADPH2:quinone reductase
LRVCDPTRRSVMDAVTTFPAPGGLDDAEAAAFYIDYQTDWFGLHCRAHLQPGETLLVPAAAGGVGGAAIQLAKAACARVVGGLEMVEVARRLGADVVVDGLQRLADGTTVGRVAFVS